MIDLAPEIAAVIPPGCDAFEFLLEQQGEMVREAPGRRTLRVQLAGRRYVLKLHTGVGWREIFRNLLQLRWPVLGARHEWQGIQRLQALGIDTMTLVAYGRQGINPAALHSFVLTGALEHTRSLEAVCADWRTVPPPLAFKRALLARVAEIARRLHQHGMNHRDLYLCHFLLADADLARSGLSRLYLIDLHRLQLRRRVPRRWRIKDLAALYFSAMDAGLTQRDVLRFVRAYSDEPLRETLTGRGKFWSAVRQRARRLYRDFHAREADTRY